MNLDDTIELHFIDGSLAGTRKMEIYRVLAGNQFYVNYRALPNLSIKVSEKYPGEVQVTCYRENYHWRFFDQANGHSRFILTLEPRNIL